MQSASVTPITDRINTDETKAQTPENMLLSGNGEVSSWVPFSSTDGNVISGIWSSEPFSKVKVHPDEMEFCYLIEGHIVLTDGEGIRSEFKAGDAFVVKPGFNGTWESITPVRKYFVIAKCN